MKNNKKQIKRVGIDARFYGPTGKGLGRYIQEIVDNIIKIDSENEYVIFLSKDNFQKFTCNNKNVKKVLAEVRWYTLAEQFLMPWLFIRHKLDLVHIPHFNVPIFITKRFVVTIHDLILTKFPTERATTLGPWFYKIKNWGYRLAIRQAVNRAKKIIAVSEFTKNDIIKQFKVKTEKIIVAYEGVVDFTPSMSSYKRDKNSYDKSTILGYNIDKPFLLYVGNAYPHKNLEGLIKVFKFLHKIKPDLRLILVGKEDYFYKRIKFYTEKLGLWNRQDALANLSPVVFSGFVLDKDLKKLYQKALAYVFPSFYEGFGLPPLEAMASGCPVVSSNKASLLEILGQAAIYFNPDNEVEMQKQIENIIRDESLRQDLIKKGYAQANKYSWQECAGKTLEVYKDVLK